MKEGAFWAIAKNLNALKNGDFEIITHFVRDDSHVDIWPQIKRERKEFSRFEYDHFPRGRIWSDSDGTVIIFINPALDLPAVIERIIKEFGIGTNAKVSHDGVPPILNFGG